jgi:CubicO group peptidase (beta-lactamase class C family)
MRSMLGGIVSLFLGNIAVSPVLAAPVIDTARMEQVLKAASIDNKFMGAVLVAQGDVVLLDKAYGSANLEWNIPNTPQTRFHISSLTKQFTAAAILLLEERGKLKTGDTVKAWYPDAPASWDRITLLNLLTQTSGIPDYTDAPDFGDTMKLPRTPAQMITTVRDKPLDFAPGEKFSYSNTNYVLLASIVEKIGGVPYATFLQENIFKPLGMKDSGVDGRAILERRAYGYTRRDRAMATATYIDNSAQYGAGGTYSTTHDMLRWEEGLLGGKLLNPTSLKKMLTPYQDARGPGAPFKGGYAMGVYVGTTEDGRREISHTGSSPGFVSMVAAYPDDKIVVILLANSQTTPFGDIVSKLSYLALSKTIILPSERKQIAVNVKASIA